MANYFERAKFFRTKKRLGQNFLVDGEVIQDIIEYAIGKKPTKEMVEKYGKEKEALYRKRCLLDPENFKLAPGAIEFLDYLKRNKMKDKEKALEICDEALRNHRCFL